MPDLEPFDFHPPVAGRTALSRPVHRRIAAILDALSQQPDRKAELKHIRALCQVQRDIE